MTLHFAVNSLSSKVAKVHPRRGLISDERGGALVEMAVTLPILLMMLTGIFSFSMALYQKLQLAEALSSGGRVIAAERGDNDPCQIATSAIYSSAPGLKSSDITLTYTIGGVNYGSGVTSCPGSGNTANTDMVAGGVARIEASYPCSLSIYGRSIASCTLATQITENVQ